MRLIALAMAAQVERDHSIGLREILNDSVSRPDLERVREAVNEDDRLPRALLDVSKSNTGRIEILVLRPALYGHRSHTQRQSHRRAHDEAHCHDFLEANDVLTMSH